jgi:hypothetical protein
MNVIKALAFSLLISPAAAFANSESQPSEIPLEGLQQVDKTRWSEFYANPGVDLAAYDTIQLEPVTVAFRRNWQRDQNRWDYNKVWNSDVDRIKEDMAELFGEVFIEDMASKGGYSFTGEAGQNVMRVVPHIVDLDVYAPDTYHGTGVYRSYTERAGKMTLKLHIYDSVTGELIASTSDRRLAPKNGYWQWTTNVSNYAEARRMLHRWTTDVVKRLDTVKTEQLN